MKIGILGGSFNPPHQGHLYLGERMRRLLSLDRIFVIPAAKAPHKSSVSMVSDEDRLAMCSLLFSDPFYTVSDIEYRLGGTSYTINTLRELKREYPEDEFFLLVGSDMLLYFDKWYRWQEILNLCTLCSFSRKNEEDTEKLKNYVKTVLKSGKVLIFDEAPLEISSTQIRKALAGGDSGAELLPVAVAEYIRERGLYQSL